MARKSFLDVMNEESEGIEVFFTEFATDVSQKNIYCFFEGKDLRYYCPRIESFLSDDEIIKPYDCDGKSNVLLIREKINRNTNKSKKTLFFIDNDFDHRKVEGSDLYVTPCYSIENFYIADKAIENFLRGEFNFYENDDDELKIEFESALEYFKVERQKFIEKIELLNIWYSLQQNLPKKKKINYPNISKLKEIKDIAFPVTIEWLKEKTENYLEITEEEIRKERERLISNNPVRSFRGKYFAKFMSDTIMFLTSTNAVGSGIFSRKRSISINISPKNLTSVLSQYAITPSCLTEYIMTRLLRDNQGYESVNAG